MKLVQKQFCSPTFIFELGEEGVKVTTESWEKRQVSEVPYLELSKKVAEVKQSPLKLKVFTFFLAAFAISLAVETYFGLAVARNQKDAAALPFTVVALLILVAVLCQRIINTSFDQIWVYTKKNLLALRVRRKVPSEEEVRTFVKALFEKIDKREAGFNPMT